MRGRQGSGSTYIEFSAKEDHEAGRVPLREGMFSRYLQRQDSAQGEDHFHCVSASACLQRGGREHSAGLTRSGQGRGRTYKNSTLFIEAHESGYVPLMEGSDVKDLQEETMGRAKG